MRYITTPIYYVNDKPHLGHAVTTLAADVLARTWRLRKEDVFFLTGTDEHGAKIAQAAEKAGKEPKAFADEISEQFTSAWEALNIKPDGFIRTTDPNHEKVVQDFLQQLYDAGHIYKGEYKGWYCVGCEEFKTETQIGPDNTCPIHLKALIEVAEESYLFKLSAFKDQLLKLINSSELKIRPESRKNEVLGFIEHEGLKDVAVSRKNVAWGVQIPWDTQHTVYVWVDALLNYLSAAEPDGPVFASGRKPQFPPTAQLIGKDILRFHAVIWPALLLAAEKPVPKELLVHGYFTINGQKMSKSLGNILAPQELIDRYGVDATRYLLLAAVPFEQDGDVSLERLDALYGSDLANNYGNLVNRIQSMLTRYCEGKIPEVKTEDLGVKELLTAEFGGVIDVARKQLTRLNRYIEETQPWVLAKDTDERLDVVLATLAENIFLVAARLAALTPDTSDKVLSLFGTSVSEVDYATLEATNHTGGKTIQPISPLFPRLEV